MLVVTVRAFSLIRTCFRITMDCQTVIANPVFVDKTLSFWKFKILETETFSKIMIVTLL